MCEVEKKSRIEEISTKYTNTIQLLSFIVAIFAIFFVFDDYINTQIEDKITSEEYISKLSKNLRPYLIFDNNGNTIYDHGGKEYISSISIDETNNTIIIKTTKYLQFAPLIIVSGHAQSSYETKRIDDNTWSYVFDKIVIITDGTIHRENIKRIVEILL